MRVRTSAPVVGSSSSTSAGRCNNAIAVCSRRRSPPDSCRRAPVEQRGETEPVGDLVDPRRDLRARGRPERPAKNRRLSRTRSVGYTPVSCGAIPIARALPADGAPRRCRTPRPGPRRAGAVRRRSTRATSSPRRWARAARGSCRARRRGPPRRARSSIRTAFSRPSIRRAGVPGSAGILASSMPVRILHTREYL